MYGSAAAAALCFHTSRLRLLLFVSLVALCVSVVAQGSLQVTAAETSYRHASEALGVDTEMALYRMSLNQAVGWSSSICGDAFCSAQSVIRCCTPSECVASGGNSSLTCVCPTQPGGECVDDSAAVDRQLMLGESVTLEMGINPGACLNTFLLLESLTGSTQMTVVLGSPSSLARFNQFKPINNGFALCSSTQSSRRDVVTLSGVISNQAAGDGVPRVIFFLTQSIPGRFRFSTYVQPRTQGGEVLPLAKYYFGAAITMDCGAFTCYTAESARSTASGINCEIVTLPPSNDPLESYYATQSNLTGVASTYSDSQLSFFVKLSHTVGGAVYNLLPTDTNMVDDCTVSSAGAIAAVADGSRTLAGPVSFTLAPPLGCNYTALLDLQQQVDFYYRNRTTELLAAAGGFTDALFFASSAVISSDAYSACKGFQESAVQIEVSADEFENVTSKECTFDANTPEFMADPCCNLTLQFSQCCSSRTILKRVSRTRSVSKALQSCDSAKCAKVLAQNLASLEQDLLLSAENCDDEAARALNNPQVFTNPLAACSADLAAINKGLRACTTDADCYQLPCNTTAGTCTQAPNDDALSLCIYNALDDEVRALMLLGGDFQTFLSRYVASRVVSAYCSYDISLSQTECNRQAALLGPNFCATVLPSNEPIEVSTVGGCATVKRYSQAECEAITFPDSSLFSLFSSYSPRQLQYYNGRCFIPGLSRSECLPNSLCGGYPASDLCEPFCIPQAFPPCDPNAPLVIPEAVDQYMNYPNRTQTSGFTSMCLYLRSYQLEATCSARISITTWFAGGEWIPSQLTSPAQCQADYCTVPCVGGGACANRAACQARGICADYPAQLPGCLLPFQMDISERGVLQQQCSRQTYPRRDGCLDPTFTGAGACVASGGVWVSPPLTAAQCEADIGCYQPGSFASESNVQFVYSGLTPKPTQQCSNCLGTQQSYWHWQPGVFRDAGFASMQPRQWVTNNPLTLRKLDSVKFSQDFSAVVGELRTRAVSNQFFCRYGRLTDGLLQLACSCGVAKGKKCFSDSAAGVLGSYRLCSGQARVVELPNVLSLAVGDNIVFPGGCENVVLSRIAAENFAKASSGQVLSSAFVQSIAPSPLAVVKNSRGIAIGQLEGDATVLQFETNRTSGNLTLCLKVSRPTKNFKKNDIAFATLEHIDKPERVKWKPMNVPVSADAEDDTLRCFGLNATSGMYAPIRRSTGWRKRTFQSSLSNVVIGSLSTGIFIWSVTLILTLLCTLNFLLWAYATLTGPGSARARKRWSDPLITFGMIQLSLLIQFFRWIYFVLALAGAMQKIPSAVVILIVDLPTFFFFTLYCLLLMKWARLAVGARGRKAELTTNAVLSILVLVANVLIYSLLVVFIIVYVALTESPSENARCSGKASSDTENRATGAYALGIVYHVMLAVIAILFLISFLIFGSVLTYQLIQLGALKGGQKFKFLQFTIVVAACSLALLLQAIVLVVTSFTTINTAGALVLLVFIELLPLMALMWTQNKPVSCLAASRTLTNTISQATSSTKETGSSTNDSSGAGGGGTTPSTDASSGGSGSASGASSDVNSSSFSSAVSRVWSLGLDELQSEISELGQSSAASAAEE